MIKPQKLNIGDTIATISPSWGCAGTARVKWQYELGVQRLKELGLSPFMEIICLQQLPRLKCGIRIVNIGFKKYFLIVQ